MHHFLLMQMLVFVDELKDKGDGLFFRHFSHLRIQIFQSSVHKLSDNGKYLSLVRQVINENIQNLDCSRRIEFEECVGLIVDRIDDVFFVLFVHI